LLKGLSFTVSSKTLLFASLPWQTMNVIDIAVAAPSNEMHVLVKCDTTQKHKTQTAIA